MNAMLFYRPARWFYEHKVPLFPRCLQWISYLLFNAYVPYTAAIGRGTRLGYGGMGVVIHNRARIGVNCLIAQQVTIGGKSGQQGVPEIGDDVYIAAGAKVIGGISVGSGSVIGANAVVVKNVPARSVVAGVPAKVIKSAIDIRNYMP